MQFLILSDLHLDFHADGGIEILNLLYRRQKASPVEALLMAGDLCQYNSGLVRNLRSLVDIYGRVVFVPGNHEYYGTQDVKEVHQALNKLQVEDPRVCCLQLGKTWLGLREGARITLLGATLWFPMSEACFAYRSQLNDFTYIPNFEPWVYEQHELALHFLSYQPPLGPGKLVYITHHAPSLQSVLPERRGSPLNPFFATPVMEKVPPPNIWVHGHTHGELDYQVGETRVICSAHGYPGENNTLGKVIEI